MLSQPVIALNPYVFFPILVAFMLYTLLLSMCCCLCAAVYAVYSAAVCSAAVYAVDSNHHGCGHYDAKEFKSYVKIIKVIFEAKVAPAAVERKALPLTAL